MLGILCRYAKLAGFSLSKTNKVELETNYGLNDNRIDFISTIKRPEMTTQVEMFL